MTFYYSQIKVDTGLNEAKENELELRQILLLYLRKWKGSSLTVIVWLEQ